MNFEIVPAHELSLSEQATVFNAAFAGYVVPMVQMDAAALARFLCAQGADLCHSRFVRADGTLAAFGYINRTGNTSRLAGMGTAPEVRKVGAAAYLLSSLLEEAKARGDGAMVLEVFEQNLPAVNLYRRFEFNTVTRLFGWRRPAGPIRSQSPNEIEEVALTEAIQMPNCFEFPSYPWQISRHAVAKLPAGYAFKHTAVAVVIGDATAPRIRVHAFVTAEQDWSCLGTTMASVIERFRDREFFAPQIFPDGFGGEIFEPLGFTREPLNQLLMRREL